MYSSPKSLVAAPEVSFTVSPFHPSRSNGGGRLTDASGSRGLDLVLEPRSVSDVLSFPGSVGDPRLWSTSTWGFRLLLPGRP